jgi:hypothetical protein
MRAKIKYICKKFINHQIKKCLLFRCCHTVDSRYNANFKLDQSVSAIHDSTLARRFAPSARGQIPNKIYLQDIGKIFIQLSKIR